VREPPRGTNHTNVTTTTTTTTTTITTTTRYLFLGGFFHLQ
jgi:hypothetical protein